jgi:hypothetical protein
VLHKLVKRDARDFGFEEGAHFTLQEFQDMADSFEQLWSRCKTNDEKENEYWNIVEGTGVCFIIHSTEFNYLFLCDSEFIIPHMAISLY